MPGRHRDALDRCLGWLLDCRLEADMPADWEAPAPAWNQGGFWPYDDQPEAAYPTVDATWDAVLALSSVYDLWDQLALHHGPSGHTREAVGQALLNGVGFLTRLQLPSGGWGVYRYAGDEPPVPPHEFTTAQTILALRLALLTSVFEDHAALPVRAEAEAALRRAWTCLQERTVTFEDRTVWVPILGTATDSYTPRDLLRASVWTATGLLALYRAFDDLKPAIAPLLQGVVAFCDRHWAPNYKQIADFEFHVPRPGKLHDSFGKWSNRYDVTVATLLLDLYNESCDGGLPAPPFSSTLWERLERTLSNILKEQHPDHGHWNEPIDGIPLAAATAMALQSLQYYLIAARHLVTPPDVPLAEV